MRDTTVQGSQAYQEDSATEDTFDPQAILEKNRIAELNQHTQELTDKYNQAKIQLGSYLGLISRDPRSALKIKKVSKLFKEYTLKANSSQNCLNQQISSLESVAIQAEMHGINLENIPAELRYDFIPAVQAELEKPLVSKYLYHPIEAENNFIQKCIDESLKHELSISDQISSTFTKETKKWQSFKEKISKSPSVYHGTELSDLVEKHQQSPRTQLVANKLLKTREPENFRIFASPNTFALFTMYKEMHYQPEKFLKSMQDQLESMRTLEDKVKKISELTERIKQKKKKKGWKAKLDGLIKNLNNQVSVFNQNRDKMIANNKALEQGNQLKQRTEQVNNKISLVNTELATSMNRITFTHIRAEDQPALTGMSPAFEENLVQCKQAYDQAVLTYNNMTDIINAHNAVITHTDSIKSKIKAIDTLVGKISPENTTTPNTIDQLQEKIKEYNSSEPPASKNGTTEAITANIQADEELKEKLDKAQTIILNYKKKQISEIVSTIVENIDSKITQIDNILTTPSICKNERAQALLQTCREKFESICKNYNKLAINQAKDPDALDAIKLRLSITLGEHINFCEDQAKISCHSNGRLFFDHIKTFIKGLFISTCKLLYKQQDDLIEKNRSRSARTQKVINEAIKDFRGILLNVEGINPTAGG